MFNRFPMIHKIYLLIISIATITLILNTVIILYVVEKNIIEGVISSEKNNLNRSAYSIELMIKESNSLANHINTNIDIRKVLYNTIVSPIEESIGIISLRNFQSLTNKIHSITLLNSKLDRIYYTGNNFKTRSTYNASNFFDESYILESINNKRVNNLLPQRRILIEKNELSGELEPKDVYTFIYSFSHIENYEDSSLIVINVSLEWLKESISYLDLSPENKLEVLDMDKQPIIDNIKNRSFYSDLYDNLPNNKEFVIKDYTDENGERNYIIGIESPFLKDWYFLKFINIKSILKETTIIRNTVIIIALSVLVVMFILAWFSTKTIKKPIADLIYNAEQISLNDEKDSQVMTQAKMKTLLDFYNEFSKEEVSKSLKLVNNKFNSQKDFFLLFLYSKDLKNPVTTSSIEKYFLNEFEAVSFLQTRATLLTIIIQDSRLWNKEICPYIKDEYSNVGDILTGNNTIVYYPNQISISSLGESIQVVSDRLNYLKCFNLKGNVDIKTIINQHENSGIYPIDMEKLFIKALIDDNQNETNIILKQILDSISKYNIRFYFRSMNRFIRTVYEELRDINPLIIRQITFNNLEELLNSINSFPSVIEHESFLVSFLEKVHIIRSEIIGIKDDNQINKIISYIINNYDDPALGSQLIADYINLNPTYLQTIFKKETKISLHEYINNYRLKKSIELLKSTSLPIKDILQQIGFTNEQSFFRLFKKEFNRTPNQFRSSLNLNLD